jgi:hypothetical protein
MLKPPYLISGPSRGRSGEGIVIAGLPLQNAVVPGFKPFYAFPLDPVTELCLLVH